jgi:hypothetical protein
MEHGKGLDERGEQKMSMVRGSTRAKGSGACVN